MANRKNTADDFWAKVNRDGPIPEHLPHLGQCWLWTGYRSPAGYGRFRFGNVTPSAHRISWVLAFGPIPPGTPCVLHRCDTPSCVRPDHLWVGTDVDNMADRMRKGRYLTISGEAHVHAKLTTARVADIRIRASKGESRRSLARAFGVDHSTVNRIVARQSWKHIP